MEIDYNNIQKHFDAQIVETKEGKSIRLEEKGTNDVIHTFTKFIPKEKESDKDFAERFNNDFFCFWWQKKDNIVLIKDWFRRKYK